MSDRAIKIFVDFDGTITKEDVGANIFLKYGEREKVETIIEKIRDRSISALQGWIDLVATMKGVSFSEIEKYVEEFEIDKSFHEFIKMTTENKIDVVILSDGFSFYINKILQREELSHLKFYSNHLAEVNGKIVPSFPYTDEECNLCANCKRNHILSLSSDDDFTIYIGNGNSDKCPAQFCDYIFAKDSLLKFCESERISFTPYKSFVDVKKKTEELMAKKRLKKRHQAELKRKTVYLQG
ncbi:MAG: 2-hydroxy-3-keto-5-methylthiopentenyl-1-phosphate phosphatase [Chlorobiaceae bacterium]|nr:2-hydroxy-3-keto-5-methylthiopentenyl-1-phosphate phosphatase [Chlorobiaceae bacterium]MBA4309148.1 2-hydroxy-3-keto-5-methylthiopentenyl-1-phosphate phosphatase [Chlorobiaceae bacterium]